MKLVTIQNLYTGPAGNTWAWAFGPLAVTIEAGTVLDPIGDPADLDKQKAREFDAMWQVEHEGQPYVVPGCYTKVVRDEEAELVSTVCKQLPALEAWLNDQAHPYDMTYIEAIANGWQKGRCETRPFVSVINGKAKEIARRDLVEFGFDRLPLIEIDEEE